MKIRASAFAILGATLAAVILLFAWPEYAAGEFTPRFLMVQDNGTNVGFATIMNFLPGGTVTAGRTVTLASGTSRTVTVPLGEWNNTTRRLQDCQIGVLTASTVTCSGGMVNTMSGTVEPQTSLSGTARMYLSVTTGAVSGNTAGMCATASSETRIEFLPKTYFMIRTEDLTNTRLWFGWSRSNLSGTAPSLTEATQSIEYFAIGYQASVSSSFLCCSGDGTNHSCTAIGAAAANTEYALTLDGTTAAQITCSMTPSGPSGGATTSVTKTTNQPSAMEDTVVKTACITTTSGEANLFYFSRLALIQN